MIPHFRKQFNEAFTAEKYQSFLREIELAHHYQPPFKIAETPVFIPRNLSNHIFRACEELIEVICQDDFLEKSKEAVLPEFDVPRETEHTAFLCIDFAVCKDEEGELIPQLIEVQGFPSLFCYQDLCANAYRNHFDIPDTLQHLFGNLDRETYFDILRRVIIGDANPENVAMIDIEPEKQNTYIDFLAAEKALGIKTLCVSDLKVDGADVYYLAPNGKKIAVERIYNRVIFDELIKRNDLKREFSFNNEYNIRWVGHPNWFVRISKHSMPYFNNRYVPESYFLNDEQLPKDLENFVLKPLYSFSGQGVIMQPQPADIEAIPEVLRGNYILQKKVKYEPVLETPDDPAKVEIRIMLAWEEGAPRPLPLTSLIRVSKGEMVGVRYNKDKTWVGASIGFFEL